MLTMRLRTPLPAALLFSCSAVLLLASCGPNGSGGRVAESKMAQMEAASPPMMEAAPADMMAADAGGAGMAPVEAPKQIGEVSDANAAANAPGAPLGMLLAYEYSYGLRAPAKQVPVLMKGHEGECVSAGPQKCQMLGSQVSSSGENEVRGTITLRGEPQWLAAFRATIEGDVKKLGGKVTGKSVTSEDLTRQIVDTEATLRAQTALRDRLEQLLRNRPGKLSDLLEVERELARVQGQIDSLKSNLAVMRARVAMSLLTIEYESEGVAVQNSTFQPLTDAFNNFLNIVAQGFAIIIQLIAAIIPFAIVIAPILWAVRAVLRRRAAKKKAAAQA